MERMNVRYGYRNDIRLFKESYAASQRRTEKYNAEVLHEDFGFTAEEIAEIMNKTVEYVKEMIGHR